MLFWYLLMEKILHTLTIKYRWRIHVYDAKSNHTNYAIKRFHYEQVCFVYTTNLLDTTRYSQRYN